MIALDLEPTPPAAAPTPKNNVKITELEGLRGALCWWVVLSHLLFYFNGTLPGPLAILRKGDQAVDGFVILSGFVIFLLLDKGRDSYGVFLFRRFFRLFPVFFVCFVASIFLAKIAPDLLAQLSWSGDSGMQRLIRDWHASLDHLWTHLALHLTLLHGLVPEEILPNSTGAFLPPAWSISLEWQFYIVAPFLFAFAKKGAKPIAAICLLVIAAVAVRPFFGGYTTPGTLASWPLPAFLPIKARYFFIGAVSFYTYRFVLSSREAQRIMSHVFLGLLTAIAIFGKTLPLFIWCVAFAAYLCRYSANENLLSRAVSAVLNLRVVQWIGRISYSTYLCHMPLIYVGLFVLLRVHHDWSSLSLFLALTALVTPATLLCSHLLFTCVEQPFIDAARRWSAPRPRPAA